MKGYILQQVLLAIMAVLALGCRPAFSGESRADYSFTMSADPTVVVLRVALVNRPRYERTFHLFGDGRAEMQVTGRRRANESGRHVEERHELQLDYTEMEELVRFAIDHGLADFRHRDLLERRTKQTCSGYVTDATGTQFTLRLDSFARGNDPAAPLENKIYVYGLNHQPRFCPSLADDYRKLIAIQDRIELYWADVKGGRRANRHP